MDLKTNALLLNPYPQVCKIKSEVNLYRLCQCHQGDGGEKLFEQGPDPLRDGTIDLLLTKLF